MVLLQTPHINEIREGQRLSCSQGQLAWPNLVHTTQCSALSLPRWCCHGQKMYFCEVSCHVSSLSPPPQFKLPEITWGLCYRPWKWCFHVMKLRMCAACSLVMMDVFEGRRPRYDWFLELCRLGEVKPGAVLTIALIINSLICVPCP